MLTAVVLSDMHVGSAYALFPSGFVLSTGAVAELNIGQRYLGECWTDFMASVPRRIGVVLLVGDLIHGQNPRESAAELTEVDPEWQQRAALELLQPLVRRAKLVYAVRGTPYHSGEAGRWEEQLAKGLGATPDRIGRCARTWISHLDLAGIFLDVAHKQSPTTRYGLMPLEREIQFALMRAGGRGKPPPDLIVRGHVHTYRWVNEDGFLGLSAPGWKLPSAYEQTSATPNRMESRLLGGVLLKLYPERKQHNTFNREDFIEHKAIWYAMPDAEGAL